MTPRRRSAVDSAASFTQAPRSLNEFVTCKFSYLTKTSAPVRADKGGAGSSGVRKTCPEIEWRAFSISASVTMASPSSRFPRRLQSCADGTAAIARSRALAPDAHTQPRWFDFVDRLVADHLP